MPPKFSDQAPAPLFQRLTALDDVVLRGGRPRIARLSLLSNGRLCVVTPESAPFVIGRDAGCDLRLSRDTVSRQHANIAFDRGRFLLIGHSTNGNHVRPQHGATSYLRRETMPLAGQGEIAIGAHFDSQDGEIVHYCCTGIRAP